MSFEEDIARFNEFYFFREFTFSENTFRKTPTEEVELADNVVWLAAPLTDRQLKERQAPSYTTPEKEQQWFKRKIIEKAKNQIRDTLNYLRNHDNIQIQNHRGHTFNIKVSLLDLFISWFCIKLMNLFRGLIYCTNCSITTLLQ